MLGWGGLAALGNSLGFFLAGNSHWLVYVVNISSCMIGGCCLGLLYWRTVEREYQAWVGQERQQTRKSQPDESARLDDPLRDRLLDG